MYDGLPVFGWKCQFRRCDRHQTAQARPLSHPIIVRVNVLYTGNSENRDDLPIDFDFLVSFVRIFRIGDRKYLSVKAGQFNSAPRIE